MEGQSVTLYLDCVQHETLDLLRGLDPHVSTEGVTVFGTRLLDEGVFEVRLLSLSVSDEGSVLYWPININQSCGFSVWSSDTVWNLLYLPPEKTFQNLFFFSC